MRPGGQGAAVGRGAAEQGVVGQRLVKNGAAGAAEGGAPPVAANALVGEGAAQRASWRQVPVERKLAVYTRGTGRKRTSPSGKHGIRGAESAGSRSMVTAGHLGRDTRPSVRLLDWKVPP